MRSRGPVRRPTHYHQYHQADSEHQYDTEDTGHHEGPAHRRAALGAVRRWPIAPGVARPGVVRLLCVWPQAVSPWVIGPPVDRSYPVDHGAVNVSIAGPCASGLRAVGRRLTGPRAVGRLITGPRTARPRSESLGLAEPWLVDPGVVGSWVAGPTAVRPGGVRPWIAGPRAAGRCAIGLLIIRRRAIRPTVVRPRVAWPGSGAAGRWVVVGRHRSVRPVIEMHRSSNHLAAR
jgi:hypothetical protein